MGRFSHAGFLLFAISTTVTVPQTAHAQERASIAERSPLDQIRRTDWARDNAREMANDWGTGGFAVSGGRAAEGRKRVEFLTPAGRWRRSYHAEMRGWGDIGDGFAVEAGVAVARDSSGRIGAPLLTETSRGSSASASLALRSDRDTALSVTVFDRYGWSSDDQADAVNRMNNGEGAARRGVALGWMAESGDNRFGLTLERAEIANVATTHTARIAARVIF